ncbi:MAG: hypothetical protein GY943_16105, partial [Chloroflexi bacterium]|nr:hypothetical protein [Chloroflexota bacterium]
MKRKQNMLYLCLAAMGLLSACVPLIPADAPLGATATPAVLADCFQTGTAVAWLDVNGDGVRDGDESPLAGIEFVLEPTVYSRTKSDADGIANIFATTPGGDCPDLLQVIATKFDGYELTTPGSVDYISEDAQHLFGFQPLVETAVSDSILIETDTYLGIIFTAESTSTFINWLGEPADDSWMPAEADVTGLEDNLAAFLQESETGELWERLPDYKRQYFGIVQDDTHLVYGNFFCDDFGVDWRETAV